jgi:8-oxo-dGTP diphosphatase
MACGRPLELQDSKTTAMFTDSLPHIRVVAAVIERQGRFLITQRQQSGTLGGLWEFPSGKVEPGESDQDALQRELRERVGVAIDVGDSRASRTHCYENYVVDLVLYQARLDPTAEPHPLRVADLRWVAAQDIENYPFPPADQCTTDLLLGIRSDKGADAEQAPRRPESLRNAS